MAAFCWPCCRALRLGASGRGEVSAKAGATGGDAQGDASLDLSCEHLREIGNCAAQVVVF
jgi:hypothetical protein